MLRPILGLLEGRKIVLASGSPRRKNILENIGFPIDVVPSRFEENIDKTKFSNLWEYAIETAKGKALEVSERLQNDSNWGIIIGADTIVVKDNVIYEKPYSTVNAREMLTRFNNSNHLVYTGVAFIYRDSETTHVTTFYESSEVTFGDIPQEAIESYINTKEPYSLGGSDYNTQDIIIILIVFSSDKAGGYGIQAVGGTLVSSIKGDYYNVQGLPLHRICMELHKLLKTLKHS